MRAESKVFEELAELCASPGYIHAIAFLCFRDNVVGFSGEMTTEDMLGIFRHDRLIRTEISTVIGLMVKEGIDTSLPTPEVLTTFVERTDALLDEIHQSMSAVMFGNLDPAVLTERQADSSSLGEMLREPIFYSGESAYSFQYRDFSSQKYARDNAWLASNKGFSIEEATLVARTIAQLQTEKLSATLGGMIYDDPAHRTMLGPYSFSIEEVATQASLNQELVESVIRAFALHTTERNSGFSSLSDFNCTNAFPLIPIGGGYYIFFQTYSLFEALYEAPFYWLAADKSYVATAMHNRGLFTEEFAADRLEDVFGKSSVHRNVSIVEPKGKTLGEIDALVLFGGRAIVLQAKSKRLTVEARKGNDGQIKSDFKSSIQDSYDQGLSCSKLLLNPESQLVDAFGNKLILPAPLREVLIICTIADHYPALSFQVNEILKIETNDFIPAPFVMDLFALDAIAEMLDTPLRFLSYVKRRVHYAGRIVSTHELTVLSHHLKKNLWLDGDLDAVLLQDDISADLDVSMAVRRDCVPGKRSPDGILTKLSATTLGKLVGEIESEPSPQIVELGLMLLELSEDTTVDVSRGIDVIAEKARRDGLHHDLTISLGKGHVGLTIHCSTDDASFSGPRLQVHCEGRKYTERAAKWFGLCLAPDKSIRFGVFLDYEWSQSDSMDAVVSRLPKNRGMNAFRNLIANGKRVGRNDPCWCGSGKKYKKCCLN